jgi:F-box protein 9
METDNFEEDMESENAEEKVEEDTEELALFRNQWRLELQGQKMSDNSASHLSTVTQAEELYWMGVSAEKNKDMGAAILYYRQAMQLVPDIETRVGQREPYPRETEDMEEAVSAGMQSLAIVEDHNVVCYQNISMQSSHFSSLPHEVIRYILHLVVLPDLDLHSLEQFSMVCKGFYMLARENYIWRKACERLWGDTTTETHANWRELYITQPHVHFNGVYISRSSYVRHGEQSLDKFYRPFHTVVYYRYLRFFSDGSVVYMTSPEDPLVVVKRLRVKKPADSTSMGYYTQSNDTIHVVVNKCIVQEGGTPARYRGRRVNSEEIVYDQKFYMELGLKNSLRKLSSQLQWKQFSCHNIHR